MTYRHNIHALLHWNAVTIASKSVPGVSHISNYIVTKGVMPSVAVILT